MTTARRAVASGIMCRIVFGGVMLVAAFAFAGHYMGQNAVAHNVIPPDETWSSRVSPVDQHHRQGLAAARGRTILISSILADDRASRKSW